MLKSSMSIWVLSLWIGLTALSAGAQEYIHGQLSGTLEFGTYVVDGDIQVMEGAVLTINPGTTLQHAGHFKWHIRGELHVMGTFEEIVSFTRQQPIEDHFWRGIWFDGSSSLSSELQWCLIEDGFNVDYPDYLGGALRIENTVVRISNCAFLNCVATEGGGIFAGFTDSLIVDNCLFSNNISEDGGGIYLNQCDRVRITNCIFNENTSTSI